MKICNHGNGTGQCKISGRNCAEASPHEHGFACDLEECEVTVCTKCIEFVPAKINEKTVDEQSEDLEKKNLAECRKQ